MSSTPTESTPQTETGSGLVAEIRLRHPELVLTPALEAVDSLVVRPVGRSENTIFITVDTDDDVQVADRAFQTDPTVAAVTAFGNDRFRIERAPGSIDPLSLLTATDGWIKSESASTGAWTVRVHFPARASLIRFNRTCGHEGIAVSVRHLHQGPPERTVVGLTRKQRALLELATDRGYFEVPRGTSQEDLAEEIGISKSAVSQRLRRAITALCSRTIE
ncbi:MAG: helix-turn-helix domain-containing protein [Natrialbaceae archaeon]|nr:helix-turn-helix domain-containing protein [Natrialbaceae archaeon]